MSRDRHTLDNLAQIAEWINTNDISNKQADSWEQLHKKVMELPEGSFLDISGIKASSKGAKIVKEKTAQHKSHESLPIVWTDDASFEIYKKGTGL